MSVKRTLFGVFISILIILSLVFSSKAEVQMKGSNYKKIKELLKRQELFIHQNNWKAYQATLWFEDAYDKVERKNWFQDLTESHIRSYSIELVKIRELTEKEIEADVCQTYIFKNQKHNQHFTLLLKRTKSGWKDSGLNFKKITYGSIVVKYPAVLEQKAQYTLASERRILNKLRKTFNYKPSEPIIIKLFSNKDVFLNSIKLSLPDWVGGWNEYKESIKFLCESDNSTINESIQAHETIHHMVSELTNDNASYWFQEGIASLYMYNITDPLFSLTYEEKELLRELKIKNQLKSYVLLKATNLESLHEPQLVEGYYVQSKSLVEFIDKKYSVKKLRCFMDNLKRFPLEPVPAVNKINLSNNRTETAFRETFGVSLSTIADKWYSKLNESIQ